MCEATGMNPSSCVKLWGPKKEGQVSPSRPIPTPIDSVVDPNDVVLLQYAYDDEIYANLASAALFRTFSIVYGPSLSSVSLRYAVLACTEFCLRRPDIEVDDHINSASRALITKDPTGFREADLFAIYLLAALGTCRGRMKEFKIHFQGFMSAIEHLQNTRLFDMSVFWPFARNDLIWHAVCLEEDDMDILDALVQSRHYVRPPTLSQTKDYCRELERTQNNPNVVSHWSLMDSVSQIQIILWQCMRATINRQSRGHHGVDDSVAFLINEIHEIVASDEMIQEVTEQESNFGLEEDDWWKWLVCLLYRVSRYSLALLESVSVMDGILNGVDKVSFIPHYRFYPKASSVLSKFEQPAIRGFIILGLATSRDGDSEGKISLSHAR